MKQCASSLQMVYAGDEYISYYLYQLSCHLQEINEYISYIPTSAYCVLVIDEVSHI